jgi:hypothetical protein
MGLWNKKPGDGDNTPTPQDELIAKFSSVVAEALKPINEKIEAQATEVKTLTTKWNEIENAGAAEAEEARRRAAAAADGELTPEQKAEKSQQALFAQTVLTNARITENEVAATLERDFPKLVPEFRQMCANTDWKVKALSNYQQQCMNAIDSLIGREARKGGLRYQKQTEKFVIEDGGARGSNEDNPLIGGDYDWTAGDGTGKTLTGTEQLAKLGLNAKDFAEMQKLGMV